MANNSEYTARVGVFVGSFDPFTIGHDSIVRRALSLFDKIVIGVGVNERKKYMQNTDQRVSTIQQLYADVPKIEVKAYTDLTVDFAHREHATYFIKGVRTIKDFEYEREQADINRLLGGMETLLLVAEPQFASISSSLVRELIHFGRDVSEFLPQKR
ncbi:pantetheine-phosphate adenylyltransferase [Prevotella aurantiaca]|uniref:pantetheine-phosphate adenylyltransferase n=1 Tax=Prevotella aurantiaca TaxID=596085 RepID=UPI0028DB0BEE|nr:pantetheine-phosphate adenylyltransferase [Prevotella aurantiaca]